MENNNKYTKHQIMATDHKNNNYQNNNHQNNNAYCINCGIKGHTFKNCPNPIISNGIINIYIENFNMNDIKKLETFIIDNLNCTTLSNPETYLMSNYLQYINEQHVINANNNIKFLMIQRKNSLGYLEFMRGKYNPDDSQSITKLLEQMTIDELNSIIINDFVTLWKILWNYADTFNYTKEYIMSEQKFTKLKNEYTHILNDTQLIFKHKEWGFPKGRRNQYETNEICAIREFEEETGIKDDKYTILDKYGYITENLIGTNGVNYAHNYYISILHSYNSDDIKIDDKEVGNIQLLNINECLDYIRPYHINKKEIVYNIYNSINLFMNQN